MLAESRVDESDVGGMSVAIESMTFIDEGFACGVIGWRVDWGVADAPSVGDRSG